MRTLAFVAVMVGVLAAQSPRPWMQGSVEKGCGLTPESIAKLKEEKPNVVIEECHCEHKCDPLNEHAEETGGLEWDGRCAARCSPSNCVCPTHCDS